MGQLITYNTLLVYFTNPLENIINLQTKLQTAQVANNRLNEVYLVASEFEEKKTVEDLSLMKGDMTSSRFPTSMAMVETSCRIST